MQRVLTEEGILDGVRAEETKARIDREIEEAITEAMTDPVPARRRCGGRSVRSLMATMTYIEAMARGMWEEMENDPSVFLIGEDIGAYGGAFKATKGFLQHFGADRVIDATLSEAAIIGAAVGAALVGMRPVAEMQFADFVTCGFNQLVVNAAKTHYRWHLPVPMVVRLPTGGYIHGGPYHSASPEAWFFHVPGLKIVAPSTPYDAKGLMKAAIRDNNPVLFLEFKYLYRRDQGRGARTTATRCRSERVWCAGRGATWRSSRTARRSTSPSKRLKRSRGRTASKPRWWTCVLWRLWTVS